MNAEDARTWYEFLHSEVLRIAEYAAGLGMHPDDALRRALDETAADDEVFYKMLAERLGKSDSTDT